MRKKLSIEEKEKIRRFKSFVSELEDISKEGLNINPGTIERLETEYLFIIDEINNAFGRTNSYIEILRQKARQYSDAIIDKQDSSYFSKNHYKPQKSRNLVA